MMIFGRIILILVSILVASLPVHSCIICIFQHRGHDGSILETLCDDHWRGTREENLLQLKNLFEKTLMRENFHLIIESKFFYRVDCTQSNTKACLDELGKTLPLSSEPYTFDNSPQEAFITTWISWELPITLLNIFGHEQLASNIRLNDQQLNHIIDNVTVEFIDPRLRFEEGFKHHVPVPEMERVIKERFKEVVNAMPPYLGLYILSIYVDLYANDIDNLPHYKNCFYDYLFDIELLSSVIISCYQQKKCNRKTLVLCGARHAISLIKVLPFIGFFYPTQVCRLL